MGHQYKPIIVIQGAQWGSEAKGMVAAALGRRRGTDICVRTGAINAGHTVYHKGKPYKMQQLPVGWVHNADLVLGPGAFINPDQLAKEIWEIREAGYGKNILVDYRAGLHLPVHSERSAASGRHYRIGATGKGCSEAVIDKISNRGRGGMLFEEWVRRNGYLAGMEFTDTVEYLNGAYDAGKGILLEGTQGTMLDLHIGPYPYTTHKQTQIGNWMAEAGLSPSLETEVVLVARTYPIRVAGNSGPMPGEITWPELADEINKKLAAAGKLPLVDPAAISRFEVAYDTVGFHGDVNIDKSEHNRDAWNSLDSATRDELAKLFEFTTVTHKLRRVARLDMDVLRYSVMLNRPKWIALTFMNYEFPELWGATGTPPRGISRAYEYIEKIENAAGAPVSSFTTGPEDQHYHTC